MIGKAPEQGAFDGLFCGLFGLGITADKRGLIENRPIQGRIFPHNMIAGIIKELFKSLDKGASPADPFPSKVAFNKTIAVRFHETVQGYSHNHFILQECEGLFHLLEFCFRQPRSGQHRPDMILKHRGQGRGFRFTRIKISRMFGIQKVLFQNHARQTEIPVTKLF